MNLLRVANLGQPEVVITARQSPEARIIEITMGNRKVMVVDDDPSMRTSCKQLLVENGFDVAEAANGIEAISVYKDFRPDMVFLDISMPEMDGLTALKEIKVMDPDAKVAMSIVMGQQALVMVALKTGAVDFLIKPFGQEEVLATIKRALGKVNRTSRI